jgi:hypothetical protein
MVLVLDLNDFGPPVELRVRGLGDCTVTAPEIEDEAALRFYYGRSLRADARAFVDALLAVSVSPRRAAVEFSVLPEADRARLRHAVAVAAGRGKEWRRLHGSHLTGDERLLCIMYWRWQPSRDFRLRLRERHAEHQKAAANALASALGDPTARLPTMPLGEVARYGDAVTREQLGVAIDVARVLPVKTDLAHTLTKQLTTRAQLNTFLEGTRSLSAFATATKALAGLSSLANVAKVAQLTAGLPGPEQFMASGLKPSDFGLTSVAHASVAARQWSSIAESTRGWHGLRSSVSAVNAALGAPKLPVFPKLAAFPQFDVVMPGAEELRRLDEAVEAAERLERRFQSRTFAFLVIAMLDHCSLLDVAELNVLSDAEVEEVVLLAVELVVCGEEFVPGMQQELQRTSLLTNPRTLRQMDRMLKHSGNGDWGEASDAVYAGGLEGAYRVALAVAAGRLAHRSGRRPALKHVVNQLPIPPSLKTLVNNDMFGGVGDDYRHGDAEGGERRQALLGVVALAGLLETCDNRPAFTVLAQHAADVLSKALQLRNGTLLGPGTTTGQ